jgi:transcription initiation factor TFIID subunit TAF12
MPMAAAQQAPLQDSLGMNPEYLLPHQRDLYRRYLQSVTDYQGQKAKEPNNTQLDGAIAEARSHINQLAAAAAQHEKQYPTPELFAQYANQYRENLMQRRAEINPNANPNLPANLPALNKNDIRIISAKNQQLATRVKEIENMLTKPDISEAERTRLRTEFQHHTTQMELLKNLFREKAAPQVVAAAAAAVQAGTSLHDPATPATPPVSQPLTPTVRSVPPVQSISMASQPTLPVATSMGQLPRPSVNTAVPPARPTLTGGYPVGNPLLGTAMPVGPPQAFHLSQDGDTRLLSKRKLQDLVKSIDPDERLEPDVEEVPPI